MALRTNCQEAFPRMLRRLSEPGHFNPDGADKLSHTMLPARHIFYQVVGLLAADNPNHSSSSWRQGIKYGRPGRRAMNCEQSYDSAL